MWNHYKYIKIETKDFEDSKKKVIEGFQLKNAKEI